MGNADPWEHVDVPFSSTLHDVTRAKRRVYAIDVGDSNLAVGRSGTVVERST